MPVFASSSVELNQAWREVSPFYDLIQQPKKMILGYDLVKNIISEKGLLSGILISFLGHLDLAN